MLQRTAVHSKPSCTGGFTLVELMVTMAVIGILALVAVPGMQAMINHSRLSGASGELTAALQLARSEAIRRNARVTVCAGTAGVCNGSTTWANWTVCGSDNAAGSNDVIRNQSAPDSVQLTGSVDRIVFRPSGQITAQTVLNVCMPTTNPAQNKRLITVMVSGGTYTEYGSGGTCP